MYVSDRINETGIRAWLERYYSGENGGRAEVQGIVEALEKLQPLPPDLSVELDLLRLVLSDAELKDDDIEVPAELEDRLKGGIHRYAAAGRRKMLRRRMARWSVAAAVALLAAVSVRYVEEMPVDLSDKDGIAAVGNDTNRIAHIETSSTAVKTAATGKAALATAPVPPGPDEQSGPAETATGRSVAKKTAAKKTAAPAEYSKSDAEVIGLAMEQIRNEVKEAGSALAEFRSSMQDTRLSLASAINESRTADVGLADDYNYDSDEALLEP